MVDYIAVQWRKALEKRGWKRLGRDLMLPGRAIEYHIIHQGQLYSGRCDGRHPAGDPSQPGSQAYVLGRRDLMTAGVWRLARRPGGEYGHRVRAAPF